MADENKNVNRSFFLYAGLIFLIALIIILISCFGQVNNDKDNLPEDVSTTDVGITERTAMVSEENARLLKENDELKKDLDAKEQTIISISDESKNLNDVMYNCNIVLNCYTLCKDKKYQDAKTQLETVNTGVLSEDMMRLYEDISKMIAQNE